MDKQRRLMGIVVNEADMSFYSKSLYCIQKDLFAADCDVLVFSTVLTQTEQEDIENSVFDLINPELLDGLIVMDSTFRNSEVKARLEDLILKSALPTVYVDSFAPENAESTVLFDNDECALAMAEHLAKCHGVKNACYVSGSMDSAFHNRVRASFTRALGKAGIALPESRIYYGNDWTGDYGAIADAIISDGLPLSENAPYAIVCCSDFTAAGMIGAFSSRGIRIPEELIVTGYSRSEPFDCDYINITSVERDPRVISTNAVRKLLSVIDGGEYEPLAGVPSGRLIKGHTCGCERINFPSLARAAHISMMNKRSADFDSYYNFMQETLIGAENFEDYLWKIDWYTHYLGDIKGFWLCLNDNIMHSENAGRREYTENIYPVYSKLFDNKQVDLNRHFELKLLLPEIFEKRDRPWAFIFNCLHFNKTNYGYTVMTYGDSGSFYDKHFVMWLRYAACAIEKQRRHMLYTDAMADKEVRDPLTGLLNVRGFKRTMRERCGDFDHPDKLLRVISVDIANLKGINSAYGYREGDKVLQRLSVILSNSAGDDDICARFSGDEFIIAGILDASSSVDDVPSNLGRNLDNYNKESGADYGIHLYTSRVTAPITSEDILDTLIYEANYQRTLNKDNHNKTRKLSSASKNDAFDPEERKYVSKLLNDNLFTYHFQPIVDAHTGAIVAYEGLMRSEGERKLSPVAILAHAEAMGRLDDVERHTMRNLFEFFSTHPKEFEGKMLFINSIPSCTLPDKEFDGLREKYGSIFHRIVIEFTEQTEASSEQLEKMLERSGRTGFKIAIDDYGTGYSNISSLLTFSPNCVKIDRSLIMNIHEDTRKQHFTRNIIDYAHDNSFKVLAEGVEKPEELKTVISMGVDLIQGYLTARPSPEVITSINADIIDKIKEFNRANDHQVVRKTFFTDNEPELSLMSLDFDNFTEVFVCSPKCCIKGTDNHLSNISIRVKDGLECHLRLEDVKLLSENNEACITVGKGSRLTLEIKGDVSMSGSINVPEGSSLDIVGDGTFTMSAQSTATYGIGADSLSSYGNIGIYLKNRMFIRLDCENCVGIGGGYNNSLSKIIIETSELEVDLSGKQLICIGCINSKACVKVENTRLIMRNRCVNGIGLGSRGTKLEADINNSYIYYDASGDTLGGICSSNPTDGSITMVNTEVRMVIKGKNIMGVGSQIGAVVVTMTSCLLDILCEGANASGLCALDREGRVQLMRTRGKISVATGNGAPISTADGNLTMEDDCEIELIKN